jgi:hypothetical protein
MASARRKVPAERDKFVERQIAGLAGAQHGVVSRRQLLALGISGSVIARRVDTGRLHTVHRGVYTVGHTVLGKHGRWIAAVLACGPHAALGYALPRRSGACAEATAR